MLSIGTGDLHDNAMVYFLCGSCVRLLIKLSKIFSTKVSSLIIVTRANLIKQTFFSLKYTSYTGDAPTKTSYRNLK